MPPEQRRAATSMVDAPQQLAALSQWVDDYPSTSTATNDTRETRRTT